MSWMFWISNLYWDKFSFSYLLVKSKLEELRGHKVEKVMLHKFDLAVTQVMKGLEKYLNNSRLYSLYVSFFSCSVYSSFLLQADQSRFSQVYTSLISLSQYLYISSVFLIICFFSVSLNLTCLSVYLLYISIFISYLFIFLISEFLYLICLSRFSQYLYILSVCILYLSISLYSYIDIYI